MHFWKVLIATRTTRLTDLFQISYKLQHKHPPRDANEPSNWQGKWKHELKLFGISAFVLPTSLLRTSKSKWMALGLSLNDPCWGNNPVSSFGHRLGWRALVIKALKSPAAQRIAHCLMKRTKNASKFPSCWINAVRHVLRNTLSNPVGEVMWNPTQKVKIHILLNIYIESFMWSEKFINESMRPMVGFPSLVTVLATYVKHYVQNPKENIIWHRDSRNEWKIPPFQIPLKTRKTKSLVTSPFKRSLFKTAQKWRKCRPLGRSY